MSRVNLAAKASQVLMLVVVVVGLIKTVPLLEHRLLQQKVDLLELEIEEKESRLGGLHVLLSDTEDQQRLIAERLEVEITNTRILEGRVALLGKQENELADEIIAAEEALEKTLWANFIRELRIASVHRGLYSTLLSNPNDWALDRLRINVTNGPNPYKQILDALSSIAESSDYPQDFVARTKLFVEENRSSLTCDGVNISSLDTQFQKEFSQIEPNLDAAVTKELQRIEVEGDSTYGTLTGETLRRLVSSDLRIESEHGLQRKYWKMASNSIDECETTRKLAITRLAEKY